MLKFSEESFQSLRCEQFCCTNSFNPKNLTLWENRRHQDSDKIWDPELTEREMIEKLWHKKVFQKYETQGTQGLLRAKCKTVGKQNGKQVANRKVGNPHERNWRCKNARPRPKTPRVCWGDLRLLLLLPVTATDWPTTNLLVSYY